MDYPGKYDRRCEYCPHMECGNCPDKKEKPKQESEALKMLTMLGFKSLMLGIRVASIAAKAASLGMKTAGFLASSMPSSPGEASASSPIFDDSSERIESLLGDNPFDDVSASEPEFEEAEEADLTEPAAQEPEIEEPVVDEPLHAEPEYEEPICNKPEESDYDEPEDEEPDWDDPDEE